MVKPRWKIIGSLIGLGIALSWFGILAPAISAIPSIGSERLDLSGVGIVARNPDNEGITRVPTWLYPLPLEPLQITTAASQIIRVPQDYSTIQAAIDAASSGDTVLVAPGTYYESGITLKDGITLKGSGAARTVIDGSRSEDEMPAVAVVYFGTERGAPTVSAAVEGFTITNGSYGIYAGYSVNLTVKNCIITNNTYGIGADAGSTTTIINNTIIGHRLAGVRVNNTATSTIKNNIIANNSFGGIQCDGYFSPDISPAATISYNDVWNNGGTNYYASKPGTGDISTNPLFVDAILRNYRLRLISPCIDAGDLSMLDPDGSRSDMGAYLYTEALTQTPPYPTIPPSGFIVILQEDNIQP